MDFVEKGETMPEGRVHRILAVIRWGAAEIVIPLTPFLIALFMREFKRSFDVPIRQLLMAGGEPLLWAPELPFFIIILGMGMLLRVHAALALASGQPLTASLSPGCFVGLEVARFPLIVMVVVELLLLGGYYFQVADSQCGPVPQWGEFWMRAQVLIAGITTVLAFIGRHFATKVEEERALVPP